MRRVPRVIAASVVALALAACSPTASSTPTPEPTDPPTAAPESQAATAAPTTSLVVDPALLAVLPVDVDGVGLVESDDGEAELLRSAALGQIATDVASALALDAPTGDFVLVHVVRLQPGVLDVARFADWRSSFDEGVCRNAGGVVRTAEVQLGGRSVFIGTCAAAVRTYYAWIPDADLLVFASSAGDRRLGEVLMKGLQP
jgi:hypothetical protein